MLANWPVHPGEMQRLEISLREQAQSYGSYVKPESTGSPQITVGPASAGKRPVHPGEMQRLEISLREQAHSYWAWVRLGNSGMPQQV